ncbi:hypothetical protein ACHAXT_004026 [Thalassiosira profunda]
MFSPTRSLASKFTRYALSVQYHGAHLLGFTHQGPRGENCILYDKHTNAIQSDLRGVESVEGRIRRALDELVGAGNYRNIQVSSRTDRGVHAWRNTFQVDIQPRACGGKGASAWRPRNLVNGINYYLSRLSTYPANEGDGSNVLESSIRHHDDAVKSSVCILSSAVAPTDVRVPNENYDPNLPDDETNPQSLPWDVRFTATRRTYAYRILHSYDESGSDDDAHHATACYRSHPFEHDRCWRIHEKANPQTKSNGRAGLDIDAMNLAGQHLVGTHDFTSFRGKGCQRASPVVTLEDVWVERELYHGLEGGGVLGPVWRRERGLHTPKTLHLVTVVFKGKSFVYRQVRNMVAALVEVGRGRLQPADIKQILESRDRSCAPGMAPAKGLFLVDVEHGDFRF